MRTGVVMVVLSLMAVSAVASEVYKWTGPDGRIQFGDRPPPQVQSEALRIRSFAGPVNVNAETSSSPGVVMLSTIWCGVCKQARQYMTGKGIPFTEHDVEKSETGRTEYKRLNGRGVPILLVGEQRMNGFSAERLEQLLERK